MANRTLEVIWYPAKSHVYAKGRHSVRTIILHSTDGRKAGDIATLTGRADRVVSSHFYITRRELPWQFVQTTDTAYHVGKVQKLDWGNSRTIGIEMEHFDGQDEDWPETQVKQCAALCVFLRQKYGVGIPILSHAAVCKPKGRKVDPRNFPWDDFSAFYALAKTHTWQIEHLPAGH